MPVLRFDTVDRIVYTNLVTYIIVAILVFNSISYLIIGQLHGAVSNLMDTHSDPITSLQPAQLAVNQTMMNQTTADQTEKNKYKIPILSDREPDLTKINPRMWWEQISEYKHLTYNQNLDEMMDQGTDQMDPHTVYHIKGDVIWALGPKAKHEIMRGQ